MIVRVNNDNLAQYEDFIKKYFNKASKRTVSALVKMGKG